MLTGNTGANQLPMKQRAKNVLAELIKRNFTRREYIDAKVVKYLLKKGLVKIVRHGSLRTSHNMVVPVEIPEEVKPRIPEPYAKRKTAKEEALEKKKEQADDATEFYFEFITEVQIQKSRKIVEIIKPGIYCFNGHINSFGAVYKYKATRIWGVTEQGKIFYVKQRATNPKKNAKVSKEEFTWVKLRARRLT